MCRGQAAANNAPITINANRRLFASALPDAKTAVIYQNDDAGKAKLSGLKAGLGPALHRSCLNSTIPSAIPRSIRRSFR